MLFSGIAGVLVIVLFVMLSQFPIYAQEYGEAFSKFDIVGQVLAWTFTLFFLPMFGLGLISPQVIRLAVPDVGAVGRTVGSIYAWSIAGAIAGTFATGYVLISSIGVNNTILLAAALPCLMLMLILVPKSAPGKAAALLLQSGVMLYAWSAVLGAVFGGFVLSYRDTEKITLETNYYTIRVYPAYELLPPSDGLHAVVGMQMDPNLREYLVLALDHLTHSQVDLLDPTFLHYKHEHIQVEMLRAFKERNPEKQSVLVIGGGGYTFPRCARTLIPTASVDVVEIDPGVTRVAKEKLGLRDEWKIRSVHMDGRQFVAEKCAPNTYDLVTLDAVNDLSVPSHLMTKEFNESVKKTLTANGVYLVTVIDLVNDGKLWKAAAHTLRESFKYVEMVFPADQFDDDHPEYSGRSVIVLYASDTPLDTGKLREAVVKQSGNEPQTQVVRRSTFEGMLANGKKTILTDQFSPTDNLMMEVFKKR